MSKEYVEGGCFVERGVQVPGPYDHKNDKMTYYTVDLLTCPNLGADWQYQLNPGEMSNEAIRTAMSLYSWGITKGIEIGRKQMQEEIRKVFGFASQSKGVE
jgi:hypothetical protein